MFRLFFILFLALIVFYIIRLILLLIKGKNYLKVRNLNNKPNHKEKSTNNKIIDADYEEIQ